MEEFSFGWIIQSVIFASVSFVVLSEWDKQKQKKFDKLYARQEYLSLKLLEDQQKLADLKSFCTDYTQQGKFRPSRSEINEIDKLESEIRICEAELVRVKSKLYH
jgi:hypothetical protein